MTIAKTKGSSNGGAYIISRTVKNQNGPRIDWRNCLRNETCRVLVSFNTKDELEFKIVNSSDKDAVENYKIEEIVECYSADLKESNSVLVLDVHKNQSKEEIVLKFDSEQECRRTLFTYKYFKMRNRLTSSSSDSSSEGSPSPSLSNKSRLSHDSVSNYAKVFDYSSGVGHHHQFAKKFEDVYAFKSLDYLPSQKKSEQKENSDENKGQKRQEYDLMQITDNNGVTHMSVESKNDVGEIDGLIYTDVDYDSVDFTNSSSSEALELPQKPQRRKQLLRRIKGKAPPPPGGEVEVVKGQVVKVSIERQEKPKENTNFNPRTAPHTTKGQIGSSSSGYESDREEWRSRSTFSSSAFHSLARPARRALAAYYRLSSIPAPNTIPSAPPGNITRMPSPRNPKNLQTMDYTKNYQSMHPEYIIVSPQDFKKVDMSQQNKEYKYGKMLFNKEYKRNPLSGSMTYLNISNRLYGLTDKLKEFSGNNNKPIWSTKTEKEKGLKPVIKKSPNFEGSKRPVVRTCSNEPPKKVTFSAFATVQVV